MLLKRYNAIIIDIQMNFSLTPKILLDIRILITCTFIGHPSKPSSCRRTNRGSKVTCPRSHSWHVCTTDVICPVSECYLSEKCCSLADLGADSPELANTPDGNFNHRHPWTIFFFSLPKLTHVEKIEVVTYIFKMIVISSWLLRT